MRKSPIYFSLQSANPTTSIYIVRMNLVIVESPAKAKTIEGFLGKDFVVKSSFGHVRDLAKKGLAVDVEGSFDPNYEVIPDKKSLISELKKLSKKSDTVWLATDEDREGEAISWHLAEVLGLDKKATKRIVFNEITKSAITRAIENPRTINEDLVNAQQARRILDRLVGFELSPVLWKKVKPSLSAGRVQSVTVRLIVEREREIMNFTSTSSYRVTAEFILSDGTILKAELPKRIKTPAEVQSFLEECNGAEFSIANMETKPSTRRPAAPFTTSTLQQEASRKLGFSVNQTMSVAQKLYEAGKITYMRTDSVNLSDLAVGTAKETIVREYGEEYSKPRKYNTKSKGAQEAHEAIRPTYLNESTVSGDRNAQRLYDLIYKRTIASQMSEAQLEKTTATIAISGSNQTMVAKGEMIKFEGFLKVYREGSDDENVEDSGVLPPLTVGQKLDMKQIEGVERFTHHPPRYTEASLVRKLEELGIGRPSTYAPTISTVQKRGYVVKEDREGVERKYSAFILADGSIGSEERSETTGAEKKKLFPTDIGFVVNDFLVDNFERIMDYNFTANVEREFDNIAEGGKDWSTMIKEFYGDFHSTVTTAIEESDRATGERELGIDPKSGRPIIARIGRFGPMVQIGKQDDEEKPVFASLKGNLSIQTITLEEALELFKLPKQLGDYEDKQVTVGLGRFGPYIRHNNSFVSIPKEEDPLDVTLERAIELIKAKAEEAAKNTIHVFENDPPVQVLKGRYGPYIKIGKKNFKIPKDVEPESLTLEQCIEISENQPAPKRGRARKKK